MAKNANAKAWTLVIGELNRRWSDQPFDLTGPSAPTIAAFGAPTQTSVGIRVTVAAVDNRTGISNYSVELATNVNGPFSVAATVSVVEATAGFFLTGLLASTQYWVQIKGIDGSVAHNIGSASNVIQQTTAATVVSDSWFPNWPMAVNKMLQGPATTVLLDPTAHSMLADCDVISVQSFYPTSGRLEQRCDNIDLVRAIRAARQGSPATRDGWPKILVYTGVHQTTTDSDVQQSALEFSRDICEGGVNAATKGPSSGNWYLHRVPPNQAQVLEPNFSGGGLRQINMAIEDMSLNSFGRTYVEQLYLDYKVAYDNVTDNFYERMNGIFQDNFDARIPPIWTPNHGALITDYDTDADGDVDVGSDFGAGDNAGGRKWAAGSLTCKTVVESTFGPGYVLQPNSARWDTNYNDGLGTPPLPLSLHPFYRKWELLLKESINNKIGISLTATVYNFTPGSLNAACKSLAIQERMLKADVDNTITGKGYVLVHANTVNRPAIQNDYRWGRFLICLAMLSERWAPCVQRSGSFCLVWDEELLKYGNPVGARSMGTLNETTLSYSMRTANFSSGVARFWWQFYDEAFVLMRGDLPAAAGVWPGPDVAVACTLPAPPSGKKFQRINASNYTNPITGATMRNQSPLINSGADVGATVSLFPLDGIVLRIVPA